MSFQRSGTFTQDQLQKFGLAGKDSPPVPTVPPPPFPATNLIPISVEDTKKDAYEMLWRDRFYQDLRDSPYYLRIQEEIKPKMPLRYSESLELAKVRIVPKPQFRWDRMPSELRPNAMRKRQTTASADKPKVKKVHKDISIKLEMLEKKEKSEDEEQPTKKKRTLSDSDEDDQEADAEMEDEEHDEEENDYGNSYFDNGEEFNEEDDSIDDGPIY